METTNTNRAALKDLAKLVRKDLKAAGLKASVRCSSSSMSECLNVKVTDILDGHTERAIIRDMDMGVISSGLIGEAKEFNNSARRHVEAIVARHVSTDGPWDGVRFVSVTVTATETPAAEPCSICILDGYSCEDCAGIDFNNPASPHHY